MTGSSSLFDEDIYLYRVLVYTNTLGEEYKSLGRAVHSANAAGVVIHPENTRTKFLIPWHRIRELSFHTRDGILKGLEPPVSLEGLTNDIRRR